MNTKTLALIMIIIIVSFFGFCIENIFTAYAGGIINNRNMVLPFLLGYGLAILAFYAAVGTPNAPKFFKIELRLSPLWSIIYYYVIAFLDRIYGEKC